MEQVSYREHALAFQATTVLRHVVGRRFPPLPQFSTNVEEKQAQEGRKAISYNPLGVPLPKLFTENLQYIYEIQYNAMPYHMANIASL